MPWTLLTTNKSPFKGIGAPNKHPDFVWPKPELAAGFPIAIALFETCSHLSVIGPSTHVRIFIRAPGRRDDDVTFRRQQIVFLGKGGKQTAGGLRFDFTA
ncbi:hypothetical protein PMI07_006377 [Rhizobium sp. CF080]|nr:hypothetical protein PMI07_006377 [Rhizobium sp. CF080]